MASTACERTCSANSFDAKPAEPAAGVRKLRPIVQVLCKAVQARARRSACEHVCFKVYSSRVVPVEAHMSMCSGLF
jgi:hypothetical protein